MAEVRVKTTSVRPFLAAAARADAETKANLVAAHRRVSLRAVTEAQGSARSRGSTAAKSAGSIRAMPTPTSARVALDKRFGGEFGANFGSIRYRQFPRPPGKDDYFIYSSIRRIEGEITEELGEARAEVFEKALSKLD